MEYFSDDAGKDMTMDIEKLQLAPMTNLGCESEFAKLDNRVRSSGGMTTIKSHSIKNIIATNGLLVDSEFTAMDEQERKRRWKWARTSEPVKEIKKLEKDFLATVKAAKELALIKKQDLKRKKIAKILALLEVCKNHGGPVTPSTVEWLDRLNEKQLLSEIGYLRLTICPDIGQKRRVKAANGKYRFQKFTVPELRNSIKQVLKPESKVTDDIDELLKIALLTE